jgi:16S rRNA (adenine1518-N6/adenine1519-N6)-dimethyltransferase
VPRVDPLAVRRALREAGTRPKKSLSQNFLVDTEVLDAILAAAAPRTGLRVLEVGPGLGILTAALVDAGAAVVAVELDERLARRLRGALAGAIARGERAPGSPGSLDLIEGSILDVEIAEVVAPPYDVVANLPYHITSPVLHRFLGSEPRPVRCVLMVQREVAERIAAPPGRMSYLSVFAQYHAVASVVRIVPPMAFEPAPSVESAVLLLDVRPPDDPLRLPPDQEDDLWRLVQASFRERRKMLHNVLVRQLGVPGDRIDAALAATGIDPDRRPQTLSVPEWLALRAALGPLLADRRGRRADGDGARRDAADRGPDFGAADDDAPAAHGPGDLDDARVGR